MEHTPTNVSSRRIFGTLKFQSPAPGSGAAPQTQAPPTTVQLPDSWDIIEAKWAAMAKRVRGGNARRAADALPPSVVQPHLRGHRH